jgi:hypothetical protein
MIKINKQLKRPDGGTVSSGSILNYNTRFIGNGMIISYDLTLYFSQSALDNGMKKVPSVLDFKYRLNKECTIEEWAKLNDSGSADLVQNWLKDLIDTEIGTGFTELV